MVQIATTNVAAPPVAKKAKYLKDADGHVYLWTAELAERGDLVAAYDPEAPEKFADDNAQIALNRELEIAREQADAANVARLQAEKDKAEAARKVEEAEELAQANQRSLEIAESKLEQQQAEHAQQMAEMQAKLDALAKQVGSTAPAEEVEQTEEPKPVKRSPRRKSAKQEGAVPQEEAPVADDVGNEFDM